MVMTAQPVWDSFMSVASQSQTKPYTIYLSPQGKMLTQRVVEDLGAHEQMVLLCGHYEGMDERIIECIVDEEISIGDYVLTGGELPAMVLIDALTRQVPGVLSNSESAADESHSDGLLEYPQYTRPYEFQGRNVPDVLISGHHENIRKWRRMQSLIRTSVKRPDMYETYEKNKEDEKLIEVWKTQNNK